MNENTQHYCVVIAVLGAWSLIMLMCFSCFFVWGIGHEKIKKETLMTGYASGSIIDFRFALFSDSTYLVLDYDRFGEEEGSYWFTDNDTIKLVYKDTLCASIYKGRFVKYYHDEFRILSIMHFKEFNPPKEIEL